MYISPKMITYRKDFVETKFMPFYQKVINY